MTSLEAALRYEARGLSVVPLHTPTATGCSCQRPECGRSAGKHPRLEWKPYQQQRARVEEIRAWWAEWPDANVGVVTGTISGVAVADIDPRNGGGETLHNLDGLGYVMPEDNPLVETGSGGLHHYFALDAPLPKAAPFDGIEVQADGALVVAPPSLHRSGRRYRWLRAFDGPWPWPLLPAWMRWACARVTPPVGPAPELLENADAEPVLGALHTRGLYLGRHRRAGLHRIRCPWAAEHSTEDPEAVVIEPTHSSAPGWAFKCLHAHCSDRRIGALLDWLEIPRRRTA